MDSIETTSHPFIVRIWLEEPVEGARRAKWRGHITHVPSGERCYLGDLDDIRTFILPYLHEMGVSLGLVSRLTLRWQGRHSQSAAPGQGKTRKTRGEDNR